MTYFHILRQHVIWTACWLQAQMLLLAVLHEVIWFAANCILLGETIVLFKRKKLKLRDFLLITGLWSLWDFGGLLLLFVVDYLDKVADWTFALLYRAFAWFRLVKHLAAVHVHKRTLGDYNFILSRRDWVSLLILILMFIQQLLVSHKLPLKWALSLVELLVNFGLGCQDIARAC